MEYRNLGTSGLRVSVVGLGCNQFGGRLDLEATRTVVGKALDLGVTLLDCADTYGGFGVSENVLGQVMGARRQDIVLVTKFGKPMDEQGRLQGGSRRYVMQAVEASLKRLRTDWIDLYEMHVPDPLTPVDETMRALDDLVTQGKVRYLGCSNFPAWQVAQGMGSARALGTAPFICCEDAYSLLDRRNETDLFPAARAYGLGVLPFTPLAAGMLTGKYRRGEPAPAGTRLGRPGGQAQRFVNDAMFAKVEALTAFAEQRGHTILDLAFGWLLSHELVPSVIAGATKPEQVESNVAAGLAWKLTAEERAEVDKLTK